MRIEPDLSFEHKLWQSGLTYIAGMDEAGRGALAGPVAVGAVILSNKARLSSTLSGVRDSKQMTPLAREQSCAAHQRVRAGMECGIRIIG